MEAVQVQQEQFLETARRLDLTDVSWQQTTGRLASVLTAAARVADLLVMHHPHAGTSEHTVPAEVAITSACPLLLIPPDWSSGVPGKHILIAWKASREASRAVREALPLLRRARKVEVVSVDHHEARQRHDRVEVQLARHGIAARLHCLSADQAHVEDTLLDYARETGADLICMGAYGHSRLREMALGGVTRELLRREPGLPLFMAH